jgi:hypothetical protein
MNIPLAKRSNRTPYLSPFFHHYPRATASPLILVEIVLCIYTHLFLSSLFSYTFCIVLFFFFLAIDIKLAATV